MATPQEDEELLRQIAELSRGLAQEQPVQADERARLAAHIRAVLGLPSRATAALHEEEAQYSAERIAAAAPGGTGAGVSNSDDLVDAKIARSEAQTETKIARLEGKLDLVVAKLDVVNETTAALRQEVKESERSVKANAWVIFGALLGSIVVVVGILVTIMPAVFDIGMRSRESLTKEVHDQLETLLKKSP